MDFDVDSFHKHFGDYQKQYIANGSNGTNDVCERLAREMFDQGKALCGRLGLHDGDEQDAILSIALLRLLCPPKNNLQHAGAYFLDTVKKEIKHLRHRPLLGDRNKQNWDCNRDKVLEEDFEKSTINNMAMQELMGRADNTLSFATATVGQASRNNRLDNQTHRALFKSYVDFLRGLGPDSRKEWLANTVNALSATLPNMTSDILLNHCETFFVPWLWKRLPTYFPDFVPPPGAVMRGNARAKPRKATSSGVEGCPADQHLLALLDVYIDWFGNQGSGGMTCGDLDEVERHLAECPECRKETYGLLKKKYPERLLQNMLIWYYGEDDEG